MFTLGFLKVSEEQDKPEHHVPHLGHHGLAGVAAGILPGVAAGYLAHRAFTKHFELTPEAANAVKKHFLAGGGLAGGVAGLQGGLGVGLVRSHLRHKDLAEYHNKRHVTTATRS